MLLYKMRKDTKRIILHDSHTEPPYDQHWLDDARQGALSMGLLSTGCHFIIERDGSVFEVRPRKLIGTHCPQNNLDSIGVFLVGGREAGKPQDNFTDVQFSELEALILELFEEFGDLEITGHDDALRHRRRGVATCPAFSVEDFKSSFLLGYMKATT